jgi:hypothetical protein
MEGKGRVAAAILLELETWLKGDEGREGGTQPHLDILIMNNGSTTQVIKINRQLSDKIVLPIEARYSNACSMVVRNKIDCCIEMELIVMYQ